MTEGIIAALVSAAAAIIVGILEHRKTVTVVEFRLKELEDKVDKHNKLVERVYKLEKDQEILSREVHASRRREPRYPVKECQNNENFIS